MAENMPIQHQAPTLDEFLAPIRERLGHTADTPAPVYDATLSNVPHVTDELDQAALIDRFCAEAAALGTELSRCTSAELVKTVARVVEQNGAGLVVLPSTSYFDEKGIAQELAGNAANEVYRWTPEETREHNIEVAASANIGITHVYAGIAETATVVQPCCPKCGRSVSLLPSVHVVIIDASTIVPAMRDVLARMEADRTAGKDLASQTVFISGPSNTADIELVRVEGVHGPTKVTYIIVED